MTPDDWAALAELATRIRDRLREQIAHMWFDTNGKGPDCARMGDATRDASRKVGRYREMALICERQELR